ncbi:acyl-CoA dehydrogenase C-terminal domain-containing protein [Psychrobium sp. 1_MG-2023]|uniref:acyl-CoA dehydrogenase C-terminal domain-containing protein n=1 Tax=Psychrobium sp. 1_MG-2023 TaxID=3062624 RepID=UPI000C3390E2|nr:acyl-CoA dehydrogenase C-terminal domain-containing protein [Psychrobium sp. 1_MG-2023]MDP2561026.1 acyl-CoA dehydrogenase C-terminal domain-containing protein [Psychrobium sp. 1_MG-2023]PKF58319.1 acyl-CoA dehydrogenase [Alteromonadales bacterium alter-6D02]
MPEYKAPLKDIEFVMNDVLAFEQHYANLPGGEEASPDLVSAILNEAAKFSEEVLAPLNQIGDQQGCTRHEDGSVTTPSGFKEAYQQYVEGGWPSLPNAVEFGGQGLPESLSSVISEMVGSANWSWGMYPGLSHGCMNTLTSHGTQQQKETYLPKLISGEWTGTMCLTEPHAGTDLGLLRTKAEHNPDGSYNITGTKIFISSGEHDMAENIIHIVLARLPGAPEGTKGISLFIVPKFNVDQQGNLLEANAVSCGSLEHKMGIHGNSTCVMNFDGATGFLIGAENRGLNCMFTFMNSARLGTAIQGIAAAESSYQGALAYAKDRLQMRSLSGATNPQGKADPIIVHPDVRRMLLTQKAFAEGNRAMLYFGAQQNDIAHRSQDSQERQAASDLLSFLTPIMKAFMTETGYESANHGVQVFGGHGFIAEWGMEQIVRDTRISMLYEGTTGIQALDLLGRKVLMSQGTLLKNFTKIIHQFIQSQAHNDLMQEFIAPLTLLNKEWGELTMEVGMKAMKDQDEVGAASVDYLMYSGYVSLAYFWAKMAQVAQIKLAENPDNGDFYQAKIDTARFYYARILPRTLSHAAMISAGNASLAAIDESHFSF